MFAENWKISLRQVRRILVLDLFGLSSLMVPGILSSMSGRSEERRVGKEC